MRKKKTARPNLWEWPPRSPQARLRYLAVLTLFLTLISWAWHGFQWIGNDRLVLDHSLGRYQGVPVDWATSTNLGPFSFQGSLLKAGTSASGKPMTIAGKYFADGLGTYSPSKIMLDLGGNYDRFTGLVGVDGDPDHFQTTLFRVYADGRLVFQSPPMARGTEPHPLDLPVQGVHHLCLAADPGDYQLDPDNADWVDLHFEPKTGGTR